MWAGDIFKPRVSKWRPVRPFLSKEQILGIADALLAKSFEFQTGQTRPARIIAEDVLDRRFRKLWKIFFDNKERYLEITGVKADCPFLQADSLDQAEEAQMEHEIDQAVLKYYGLAS
jgi:spore coat polysaccharide biosynthesis protein SpsF (cytidylyltransferase family)